MSRKLLLITLSIILSLVFFYSQSIKAYVLHGWKFEECSTCDTTYQHWTWGDRLDDSPDAEMRDIWKGAISSWHYYQDHIGFTYNSSSNNYLNTFYESSTSLFGKSTSYVDSNDYVVRFEALLNVGNSEIRDYDTVAESTGVHELGHIMGIDHNSGTSIMNSNRDRHLIFTPQADDINGINAIYN